MNGKREATKHTPGPWALDDDGFVYGEGFIVSDPHSSPEIDLDEREANAQTKHTPGPWEAREFAVMGHEQTKGIGIYSGDDCMSDLVFGQGWSDDQVKANAHLIAAAPELLDALQWALDDPDSEILGEEWAKAAQAAIAKAKGE